MRTEIITPVMAREVCCHKLSGYLYGSEVQKPIGEIGYLLMKKEDLL